ncbi:HD domain-containing protein [Streptomyces sp. NBC_00654]|uniref:HD domain-containing protein n=1 Tax=Streptomyces sp. NBC_00654 TaxID=2975799 RepID=UPI002252B9D0|nr:HD domain-containing protein [Streptomyces sp. NBC_00654]MCX4970466.1 HD domain-containing protein [Streptomyces sp. NBC_00654]
MTDTDNAANDTGTVGYMLEMGALKRGKRSGWWIAGVKDPETIAEHSWRTAVIGAVLAMMEGADPARVALLATFHDTQETRIGDIPWIGRRYIDVAKNEQVTADQVADAHPSVAEGIKAIVHEYENSDSLEVLVAHDADKLECMIQGLEYLQQGYPAAQEWVDSTRAKLKTPSALQLAEAAQTMSLAEWQRTYLR